MQRLGVATLDQLEGVVVQPSYAREELHPGIVHFGIGAFHRAHQAVYTEDAVAHSGGRWGIIGVSLRSDKVSRQLQPQQGLYSVLSQDADDSELRVIGVLTEILVAPESPARVAAAIADADIKVITLTVTEKAYCLAPDGQSLDLDDELIQADLANPEQPGSVIGLLALGLRTRMKAGGEPITVLSCDNLSRNSERLREVLIDYLEQTFPPVIVWLQRCVTFPSSMVDRIVPAISAEQKSSQAERLGVLDEAAVTSERFMQWIVEDRFASDRPAWDKVGVQFVEDILPFEQIKLLLLNASHSAIAYCGILAELKTVDQVMADPPLRQFIEQLMDEDIIPSLNAPKGFLLERYRDQLLSRFSNPHLDHQCMQIAMDGSEKISQRWLPTLQLKPQSPRLLVALSAWSYLVLHTEFAIDDPRAGQLLGLRNSKEPEAERISGILACARISAEEFADIEQLKTQLEHNMRTIDTDGIRGLLASV